EMLLTFMRGKMSARKVRLFAVASAYTIWDRLMAGGFQHAVEVGEAFADGLATEQERLEAFNQLCLVRDPRDASAFFAALITLELWKHDANFADRPFWQSARMATGSSQPDLFREIFGNPFHPIGVDPSWLSQEVVGLANRIYEQKNFNQMPMLADAL